jgi:molybdopterin converting factor small subunit
MSIKVNIHPMLRFHTDGHEVVEVKGNTVGECLDNVFLEYPELKTDLLEEDNTLKRHFEIFVNAETAYPEELNMPVKDGDEIYIIMMVVGG